MTLGNSLPKIEIKTFGDTLAKVKAEALMETLAARLTDVDV